MNAALIDGTALSTPDLRKLRMPFTKDCSRIRYILNTLATEECTHVESSHSTGKPFWKEVYLNKTSYWKELLSLQRRMQSSWNEIAECEMMGVVGEYNSIAWALEVDDLGPSLYLGSILN